MNKTIYVLFAALILAAVSVSAIESLNGLYKYRCEIVRPATEFRAERSFGYIGILGRLSDGSLTCFVPSNKRTTTTAPVVQAPAVTPEEPEDPEDPVCHYEQQCTTITEEECVTRPVCEDTCHKEKTWKQTCEWKHGKLHCNYGWVWTDVCITHCRDVESCGPVNRQVCKEVEVCAS
jgi:hypothetical protein